jgi:hypothetical protein
MMPLVRVGFSSKLQVSFNCSLVPNVAKNMADLINIKQIYITVFCRAPRSFLRVGEIPSTWPNAQHRSIALSWR